MREEVKYALAALMLVIAAILALMPYPPPNEKETISVFHAGSLSAPFGQAEKEFEALFPQYDVQREAKGSKDTIRKVTELGREADIVASADYKLMPEMMYPDYADWNIIFAKNSMVVAYTEKSRNSGEITSENWHEILSLEGAEVGHSNPATDPCGYRSLMVLQLAESHYGLPGLYGSIKKNAPEKNIRDTETDLVAILQAGEIDYLFIYRSVAEQHGLQYITLPEEIDLSSIKHDGFYSTAKVTSTKNGAEMTDIGSPIAYGITIPKNSPGKEGAEQFISFLLSERGRQILSQNGQAPVHPAETDNHSALPEILKGMVVET